MNDIIPNPGEEVTKDCPICLCPTATYLGQFDETDTQKLYFRCRHCGHPFYSTIQINKPQVYGLCGFCRQWAVHFCENCSRAICANHTKRLHISGNPLDPDEYDEGEVIYLCHECR